MEKVKRAVVLFNLGGPDSLKAVKPFLFNLFNDKAILNIPQPFRAMLAWIISSRRAPYSQNIYRQIGDKSPIAELTLEQAKALEIALNDNGDEGYKVFFTMRCWKPFAKEVVAEVKEYAPDEIILLPLYPQFSTTTSASSIQDWQDTAKKENLNVKTHVICCYPNNPGFIDANVELIKEKYEKALKVSKPIILFSAHGIPINRIEAGDPYEWQVQETVKAIVQKLGIKGLDYKLCYQSRVGPLKWLQPATEEEIINASRNSKPIIVVPIAFVSEHSETLVELDKQYKKLAQEHNCPLYQRVKAVGVHSNFITGLKELCLNALKQDPIRICPKQFKKCWFQTCGNCS
jgi:ferrochelatase